MKWLVMAHATEARIYDLSKKNVAHAALIKTFDHEAGRLKNGELVSDKPGDYGRGSPLMGTAKFTKDHSPHEMELHYFAEQLAHWLEHERTAHHFDALVVAMDAHFYGIFEEHVSDQVKKLIVKYLHKNYLAQPEADIEKVVHELMLEI